MWPFAVNWREPYEVTHAFLTDIFTSRAGLETRRALRKTPRKSLGHTAFLRNDTLVQFNRLMMTAHNMQIIFPELTRQAALAANVAAEGTALLLTAPAPRWMAVGGEIVIGRGSAARVGEIEQINGAQITLVEPVGAFVLGERVYHALTGRLANRIDAQRVTNAMAEARVIFNVNPGSEIVSETDQGPAFGGREIFPWPHNWASGQDVSQEWPVELVDFDAGVIAAFTSIDIPAQLRGTDVLCRSPEAAESLLEFFIRMRGRRGEFMRPSGEQDLTPMVPLQAGQDTVLIRGRELFETFLDDPIHGAIVAVIGGMPFYRTVANMLTVGANTLLTVDQPWPTTGLPSRISWFYNCRLESDELMFSWRTNHVAQTSMTSRTLPFITGVDYSAYRATPAGEDRVTPEGEERIVIYL